MSSAALNENAFIKHISGPIRFVYLLVVAFFALMFLNWGGLLPSWIAAVPKAWTFPIEEWINAVVNFGRKVDFIPSISAAKEGGYQMELITFKEVTRAIAKYIDMPFKFMGQLLIKGIRPDRIPVFIWLILMAISFGVFAYWRGRIAGIVGAVAVALIAVAASFGMLPEKIPPIAWILAAKL